MKVSELRLPADLDVPRLATTLSASGTLLFERFSAHDRKRDSSLIAVRSSRIAAATFNDALDAALRHGAAHSDAVHFVMLGAGGGRARELGDRWTADAFLVARIDEAVEIDHRAGVAKHWSSGLASLEVKQLAEALDSCAGVERPA